eukprot:scaffold15116_cov65-Cylindrotheca_fusiformis.AAC.1
MNNFPDALHEDEISSELPLNQTVVLDEANPVEKKQKQGRQRNTVAMCIYDQALVRPEARTSIVMSKSADWPDGLG